MTKIAPTLWVRQWCLRFSQKAEVPWVPESFQVGASGCPTGCHEDLGAEEASKGCLCSMVLSLRGHRWINHQHVAILRSNCLLESKMVSIGKPNPTSATHGRKTAPLPIKRHYSRAPRTCATRHHTTFHLSGSTRVSFST